MPLNLTNHKAIDSYYAALATYHTQDVTARAGDAPGL